jgi:hypothetical protein
LLPDWKALNSGRDAELTALHFRHGRLDLGP